MLDENHINSKKRENFSKDSLNFSRVPLLSHLNYQNRQEKKKTQNLRSDKQNSDARNPTRKKEIIPTSNHITESHNKAKSQEP